MLNENGSPTLTNCTFSYNTAILGGGISNWTNSNPTIDRCTISSNTTTNGLGAGIYCTNSSPTITNCTISNNVSSGTGNQGGGIHLDNSSPPIINCTFSGNQTTGKGGWINNDNYSAPTVINCKFIDNIAGDGGGMYTENPTHVASPTVINCIFRGNIAARYGGGILNTYCNTVVINCTFNDNSANDGGSWDGGAAWNMHCNPVFYNCIFWGNSGSPPEIFDYKLGDHVANSSLYYCDIEGGWSGVGSNNINQNPQFVAAGSNLRLQSGSPCIDFADNTAVAADDYDLDDDGNTSEPTPLDLDGAPRFVYYPYAGNQGNGIPPLVDMGAYEFQYQYSNITIYVDGSVGSGGNGSNWGNAYKYLSYALGAAEAGDTIFVAEGTYKPTTTGLSNPRTATFQLVNGVTVYGGFPTGGDSFTNRDPQTYVTTLSGDIGDGGDTADNCYHVVTSDSCDSTTILDGFTITAGNANGSSYPYYCGGGMYNSNSNPTLTDCTFSGNSSDHTGGGIYNSSSNPTLTNCTFSGNLAETATAAVMISPARFMAACQSSTTVASRAGPAAWEAQPILATIRSLWMIMED